MGHGFPQRQTPRQRLWSLHVDGSCIDCDQCRALAPEIFKRDDESGLSYIARQPATAEEVAQVEEIAAGCATSSIGNDGAA